MEFAHNCMSATPTRRRFLHAERAQQGERADVEVVATLSPLRPAANGAGASRKQNGTTTPPKCHSTSNGANGAGASQPPTGGASQWPLHVAVWDDDVERLRELSSAASPEELESVDPRGHTPLFLAVRLHRVDAARVLVRAGASPLAKDASGWVAQSAAAWMSGDEGEVRS